MVLMDSHLQDYRPGERGEGWLDQVVEVGGQATVIWHQHAFSPDYGWRPDYEVLLRSGYFETDQ